MDKINVYEKFSLFMETWSPKIVGELNDAYIKLAKLKGEFVWHRHENEDELFYVLKGQLKIKLKDKEINLSEGEFFIVPKGIDHLPVAEEEAHVIFIEPKSTLNTGNVINENTVEKLDWI